MAFAVKDRPTYRALNVCALALLQNGTATQTIVQTRCHDRLSGCWLQSKRTGRRLAQPRALSESQAENRRERTPTETTSGQQPLPPTQSAMPPTLPVELIQYIIGLAHEAAECTQTLQAQYDLLNALSLVSLTFRDIAQPLLVARAWLRSSKDTRTFLRAIAREGPRLSTHVVGLRFDRRGPSDDPDKRLALGDFCTARSIMRECQQVRMVVLQGGTVDMHGLSLLQGECAHAKASTAKPS